MSPAISPVAPSPTLPLSSRRPSVSFGGFGLRVSDPSTASDIANVIVTVTEGERGPQV